MSEENQELLAAISAAAVETDGKKRLPCAEAFRLAEEYGVGRGQVGRLCNEQGVKIAHCQLGCF